MSVAPIQQHILSDESYRDAFQRVVEYSVAREFSALDPITDDSGAFDWRFLLFCASVLAKSEDAECQEHSLRIATAAMTLSEEAEVRDAAALLLNDLGNRRTIQLSQQRGLLHGEITNRVGFSARLAWMRRQLEQTIVLGGGETFIGNTFQKRFWDEVDSVSWLSVSAPTSVGKSFIALHWLADELGRRGNGLAIIVVPTRALIHQFEMDLRRLREERGFKINVSSIPSAGSIRDNEPNVLVFTQERLHVFLNTVADDPSKVVDYLFVDEAQKVSDGARGVLLQDAIERVVSDRKVGKVLYSSPLTTNPEILIEDAPDGVSRASIKSEDVTVGQNLIWAKQRPDCVRNCV
jgi:hypothetical protein